jgi:hypothetical protein
MLYNMFAYQTMTNNRKESYVVIKIHFVPIAKILTLNILLVIFWIDAVASYLFFEMNLL